MKRLFLAVFALCFSVCLAACGRGAPVPTSAPPAVVAGGRPSASAPSAAPSDHAPVPASRAVPQGVPGDAFAVWLDLPGCDHAAADAIAARIAKIEHELTERDVALRAVDAELGTIWASPCLSHVSRFFRRPSVGALDEMSELWAWRAGLQGALMAMNGRLYTKHGERFFVVPPGTPPPQPDASTTLAPWICPEKETHCGNAQSFVERAELAYDAKEDSLEAWHAKSGYELCQDDSSSNEGPRRTAFEQWAQCIGSEVPRTYRYPKLRYRAPERGWLVLRGRRGHYQFADEVRAYDLQTGAAYVASSHSALVLDGPGVDYAGTDAARKPEGFTGNVAADLVREIAFVLVTAGAPTPKRSRIQAVALPTGLEVTLSPKAGVASMLAAEPWYGTSAQTKITYELVGAGPPARGDFTWPDSYVPAEDHADVLVRILEAGLERGCARAKLPANLWVADRGGVSPIDADPRRQLAVASELDRALDALRSKACPDAR